MDVKVRPKSTNVELQGVCPLPTDSGGKLAPWQTAEEQNSSNNQVVEEGMELEDKVPELYNLILEGERTGKPLPRRRGVGCRLRPHRVRSRID